MLGKISLGNRIVMPPMATELATERGEATDEHVQHYAARSRDLGLLIVEHTYVSAQGKVSGRQLGIHTDRNIASLRRVVDSVHAQGTPIVLQITHGGSAARSSITGEQPVAPSPIVGRRSGETPRELTRSEIEGIADAFVNAAMRAAQAGFEGVELHGAHGFLLNQFMSPLTNKREDEYGGTLTNRMTLARTIVRGIRRELGADLLLLYRLGAEDMVTGGMSLDEGIRAAQIIEEAGVDCLDVSAGLAGSRPVDHMHPGYFVPQAEAVKRAVRVPVIGIGGIATAEQAQAIIASKKVDLVAVGRAVLANPAWATEAIRALKK